MTVHWASLLGVFAASFGATIAVVVLVTLSLLRLSARVPDRGPGWSPVAGTTVAGACLAAAAAIVLFGIWAIVAP